jgi:hypothetical protein
VVQNAVVTFDPANATVSTYVSDPRLEWIGPFPGLRRDLHFTDNQPWRLPCQQGGVQMTVKHFVLWRVALANSGSKIFMQ